MRHTFSIFLAALALQITPLAAQAAETEQSGLKGWLAEIVTEVPNPKSTPCNGVVDCRKKGNELETVYQLKQHASFEPRDYPANCYVPGDNGKYVFSPAACQK